MATVIRMPRMSDTMEEGNIVEWLKAEGDSVEPGETLAEVETDKATMELDAYEEGVLLHIAVKEGTVAIDEVIAVIGEEGEDWKAALEAAQSGSGNGQAAEDQKEASEPTKKQEEQEQEQTDQVSSDTGSSAKADDSPASSADEKRLKASPLARSMAKDAGVNIAELSGSGDGGRVVKRDVEAYLEQQKQSPAPSSPPQEKVSASAPKEDAPKIAPFHYGSGGDNFDEQPVSQMRKVIARRLGESKFSAPHFYLTIEINMAKAIALRKRINEVAPTKISFNDLVIKAVAASLRQHPTINSSWLEDKIRTNHDINIGVAVAVPEGLLVPVIRHADMKTLSQVNQEVKTLAGKAKDRKLQPQEMQGNTFTISNLGMFGIEEFTAIINPPDACIMAVGGIIDKAIVQDGQVVPGKMMKVTLSCDHRVVDGVSGAEFLLTFKDILEDPIRLMV